MRLSFCVVTEFCYLCSLLRGIDFLYANEKIISLFWKIKSKVINDKNKKHQINKCAR